MYLKILAYTLNGSVLYSGKSGLAPTRMKFQTCTVSFVRSSVQKPSNYLVYLLIVSGL